MILIFIPLLGQEILNIFSCTYFPSIYLMWSISHHFFNYTLFSPSGTLIKQNLKLLLFSHRFLGLSSLFDKVFFCFSNWIISTDLFKSIDSLLYYPYCVDPNQWFYLLFYCYFLNFHLVLVYIFSSFERLSNILGFGCACNCSLGHFIITALKTLLGNSNIFFVPALTSVNCLSLFRLRFSLFWALSPPRPLLLPVS